MRGIWNRFNYHIRHQVYLRVLPVVLLSVTLLGVFSLVVFERHTLERATGAQQKELAGLTTRLRFQVARLAMMAELRKAELLAQGPGAATSLGRDLVLLESVSASAQINPDRPQDLQFALSPEFQDDENLSRLEAWYTQRVLGDPTNPDAPRQEACAGLAILDSGPWHQVLVFPPVHLQNAALEGTPEEGPVTHLPLLVRKKTGAPTGGTQSLLFMDLGGILSTAPTPDWFCMVASNGQILHRQDRASSGFLSRLSGPDLLAMDESFKAKGNRSRLINLWSDPWLIGSTPSPLLPLTIFSARPANDLRDLVLRYLAFVTGVALLSLLFATVSVMRVVSPLSRRLETLRETMAAIAQGEYSRRLDEGRWDEIGQVVGYFNLMATSLDEAHREVREKTLRLRAALENMRVLDKAKDDFLVLISHEVRTPLTAIMGGVDFLNTIIQNSEPEQKAVLDDLNVGEVVGIVQSSGDRLSGFMTDAIQMTAIQSSDRKLDLKATPVVDLVEMGLVGIRERAEVRGITVDNQLEDRVWSLLGDKEVLKVAMQKIMDNALKHNRDGGRIVIRETWEVPEQGTPETLLSRSTLQSLLDQPGYSAWQNEDIRWRLIEVFNSGEPIPDDRREALFRKFELVGRIEHHHKGSGLSLPIAQGAVACHGGRILLHSDGEDGNSFFLLLPTLLDSRYVEAALANSLWDDAGQGVGGAAGNEKVGQVADLAALKVEVDDIGPAPAGDIDQGGGGMDGAGGADHEEKVTVTGHLE